MTRRDDGPPVHDRRGRPSWLRAGCPGWCTRDHGEHDHPEDRFHRSEALVVAASVATQDTIPVTRTMEGLDLVVWLGRYVGEGGAWLAIEPTERREPRLVVSLETARGLLHGLAEQLAAYDAG